MKINAITTEIYRPEEHLVDFIVRHLQDFGENQVLAITSKIVSIAEGRLVPIPENKGELIRQESDYYLGEVGYGCHLTIKHGLFIPSAGIDESNSETGQCILYPKDPFASAKEIHQSLKLKLGLENFGVVLTDSRTVALRRGVVGTALAYWGFQGVHDHIGDQDLFGREMKVARVNVAEALATAATLMMGECDECRPLATIKDSPVRFQNMTDPSESIISPKDDLFFPLYKDLIK